MRRPKIKVGDICRFHKNFGALLVSKKAILIILSVDGPGDEANSTVYFNMHYRMNGKWLISKHRTKRRNIWYTGANIKDKEHLPEEITHIQTHNKSDVEALKNWLLKD